MRVLIVGAGAVGQVLGYGLAAGGAAVSLLARPRQVEAARSGLALSRRHRFGGDREPSRWQPRAVYGELDAALAERWDVVVLGVSSTALDDRVWLEKLLAGTAPATIVSVQPGLRDAQTLAAIVGAEAVVRCLFGLMAWQAPLRGDDRPGVGIAWWVPPGGGLQLGGDAAVVEPLVACLSRGGVPTKRSADIGRAMGPPGALLDVMMAGLELAGWSFASLRRDRRLRALATRAGKQAATIAATHLGVPPPFGAKLLGPTALRWVLGLAPHVAPLDLEVYFETHFTKVRAQTVRSLSELARTGAELGCARDALDELLARFTGEDGGGIGPNGVEPSGDGDGGDPVGALGAGAAAQLGGRRVLSADPSRPQALKRNLHEVVVGASARAFAAAFAELLADPERTYAGLRLRRVASRLGRPFEVGERFHGVFELAGLLEGRLPAGALARLGEVTFVRRLEERLVADFAELERVALPGPDDADASTIYEVAYRYLSGSPIAGRSTYRVVPLGPNRCRFEALFEFQESGLPAAFVLHYFGVRAHDAVVAAQVEQVAERLGAQVLGSTLNWGAGETPRSHRSGSSAVREPVLFVEAVG